VADAAVVVVAAAAVLLPAINRSAYLFQATARRRSGFLFGDEPRMNTD
jgi:hypothetical protein